MKKLFVFVLSVCCLTTAVFYLSRLAPGDPLVAYYGDYVEKMGSKERALAEKRLGIHQPVSVQYIRWLKRAAHGDFGISYKYKTDVVQVIYARAGNTLVLGGTGFLLVFLLAPVFGVLCARRQGSLFDRLMCKAGVISSCIPEFWLSFVLILLFAIKCRWLPSSGAYTIGKERYFTDRIRHLILPLSVVVLSHLWYYASLIRTRIIQEMEKDYALFAKAKGLRQERVLLLHCLRNVLPAYISLMAVSVPHILGGTYMVELVFSYPGLGTLAYESARYQDYNLLMLLCILSGILVIVCSIAAQAVNEKIDPRIRFSQKTGSIIAHKGEHGNVP